MTELEERIFKEIEHYKIEVREVTEPDGGYGDIWATEIHKEKIAQGIAYKVKDYIDKMENIRSIKLKQLVKRTLDELEEII